MAVTIRDVARHAGVGLGTVSRVINDSPGVSPAMRRRVLEAIAELGFVPSRAARRLSLGRTLSIAAIVPFFTRPAFVERLRGVEHVLASTDYDLIIYNVETPQRRDLLIGSVPRRDRVDGVLIISLLPNCSDISFLGHADVPVVLVDVQEPTLTGLSRISTDDVGGARMVVDYLIALGHRRIAFVGDQVDSEFNFTSSRDRFRGYQQALSAAGIPFRSEYYAAGPHGREAARQLAVGLLRLPDLPTAVFAASDTQAIGVLEACREAGLDVPGDISIVGYDNVEFADYLGLTTVHQQLFASGTYAAEVLLRRLAEPYANPESHVLPTSLIVRRTTAPPRQV